MLFYHFLYPEIAHGPTGRSNQWFVHRRSPEEEDFAKQRFGIVTPRNTVKRLSPSNRPKSAAVTTLMEELQEEGAGTMVTKNRSVGFVKKWPMAKTVIKKYKLDIDEMSTKNMEVDNFLSTNQISAFSDTDCYRESKEMLEK